MAKFFTYEERLMLQRLLKEGMSFKKIAAQMYKDPATISREVRKYAVEIATGKPGYSFNACPTIDKCTLLKTFYDAEKAHLKSHQVISVSRSGPVDQRGGNRQTEPDHHTTCEAGAFDS